VASACNSSAGDFWAITSYFNPVRYRRRLSNFKIFRKHLTVPLVAVELAYSDDFELKEQDADILVQLRGGAVLWHKERLLNVALKALPRSCRKAAWLDCDIVFRSQDWAQSASALLERMPLVQLFKLVHDMPAHWDPACSPTKVDFTRPSAASMVASGIPAASCVARSLDRRAGTAAPGFAWAARRELLDRHGFYDACIVGGGDSAMVCGAHGCPNELADCHHMNERQRQRYQNWAERLYGSVKAETAFVDGDIFHLWHGDMRDRAGRTRHEGLRRFRFDPFNDISIQENGCWRWNTDKPEMHHYVQDYFISRREDG